ncbi:protein prenylyltransferase [Russula earlei]|uniref:Protein prenylyltransferase n=1 Tax=Russula earlei TaxID=71964 RepID=A0ACC0UD96_9AGAM|nr:protein prenylyltransferase [Russula earlei]
MALKLPERPEWTDVVPVPQYENIQPLAPIFYSPEYKDATDYFRGIVKTGEKSPRVLELTETIIRLNPAHYSAWQYRYETLITISASLELELVLTNALTKASPKTYQVWHHRRLLQTALCDPVPELAFNEEVLKADAKNYHTWSHRQWLLVHFDQAELWAGELSFVERLLAEDVRNNSAWHHRFFISFETGNTTRTRDDADEAVRRELAFAKERIALAPNNASAWNYLRGAAFAELYVVDAVEVGTDDVLDLENPAPSEGAELPCAAAIEFMADVHEARGKEGLSEAVKYWRSLAHTHDTIRKSYWEFRIRDAVANAGAT